MQSEVLEDNAMAKAGSGLRNYASPGEIKAFIIMLTDRDGLVRKEARRALVDIGYPAVPELIRLLDDKRAQVRWEAVNALSEIADPDAAPALVKRLEDKVFEVRWLAAKALINLGVVGLIPALQAIILTRKPNWLWDGVRHIVRELAKDDLAELLSPLKEAFDNIDARIKVPLESRKALEKIMRLSKGNSQPSQNISES